MPTEQNFRTLEFQVNSFEKHEKRTSDLAGHE